MHASDEAGGCGGPSPGRGEDVVVRAKIGLSTGRREG